MNDLDDFYDQDLKQCSSCREEQPLDCFHKNRTRVDGFEYICKKCDAQRKAHHYKKNRTRRLQQTKDWQAANPGHKRDAALWRRYKITHDDYLEMLEDQNGGCAICGAKAEDQKHGVLYVDHNHDTDEVRGLLCNLCNVGIGNLQDSPKVLTSALQYLLDHGHYGE